MGDNAVDGSSGGTSSESKKRKITIINDPIWGPIELHPLCMRIINTPQFQRLRNIKQLGGCSFVYPGACHSRFEHSIGTAYLARMMGEELQKKHTEDKIISDDDILCLEVAGLCHDLGHGPFSHLFDQQFREKCAGTWKHEDLSKKMLGEIFKTLEQSGVNDDKQKMILKNKNFIEALITPPKNPNDQPIKKPFLYEIIANEENKIDVDKWDYFSRDCHMLGLHHNFQSQRSIKLARVVDNHISFPKSEYFNLFDMFYTRFTLHRRAYQHPVVKAVEMMIGDAFFKAEKKLMFPPDKPTEGQKCLSKSVECMDAYLWVTDDVLHQIRRLKSERPNGDSDLEDAQKIINRIYCRELYTLIGEKSFKWSTVPELIPKGTLKEEMAKKISSDENDRKQFEIEVVEFHYGAGRTNPMEKVKFHSKEFDETSKRTQYRSIDMKDKKSDMMPTTFEQIYLRLYWKGSDQAVKQKLQKAFFDIGGFDYTANNEHFKGELTNM